MGEHQTDHDGVEGVEIESQLSIAGCFGQVRMRQAAQVFPEQPAHATEVDVIHIFWCRKARDERRPFAMLERVAGRSIARRELSWLPGEMRAQPGSAVDKHIGESFSHGIVSPATRR